MKLFIIPVEICSRELEYKFNLGKNLTLSGDNRVVLCRPWVAQKLGILFKKLNWIGQNLFESGRLFKNQVIDYLHENNSKVFYFDEEGGVYPESMCDDVFEKRYAKKHLLPQDCVFSWGCAQFKLLKKMGVYSYALGHPRFIKRSTSLMPNSNSVLIMTNFSLAFASMSFSDRYFDKQVYQMRQQAMLKDISNLFDLLNSLDAAVDIHIRPHPSEDRQLYRDLFRHYDNIFIRDNEDLLESFRFAVTLYHFDCTTALDALCCGIPSVNLGDNPVTIISDIKDNGLSSNWLNFPCELGSIENVINQKSIVSNMGRMHFRFFVACVYVFECAYLVKELFSSTSYSKDKFGFFNHSKNIFKFKILC